MDWTEIVREVGLVSIVSGLIVWLLKQLGQDFIDKKFKAYELELKYKSDDYTHQLDKSLESHRAELSIIYAKASRLHDRRLEIIAELYKKLVRLDDVMNIMTALVRFGTSDDKTNEEAESKRIENARKAYNDFQSYYTENKIFFANKTNELLDTLRTDYFESYWDYTAYKLYRVTDFKLNLENAKMASEKVKKQIPPILRKLEAEFRQMIGVESDKH